VEVKETVEGLVKGLAADLCDESIVKLAQRLDR
jgi:hypothetical protein